MIISTRRILVLLLTLPLVACSTPNLGGDTEIFEEAIIIEEPVLADPSLKSPTEDCNAISGGIDDGIGGTGCEID